MKCKQAKSNIALWIGNDLDEADVEVLRRHLSQCWHCRTHWREMKNGLKVLHEPLSEPTDPNESTGGSIWPGLSVRLAASDAKMRRQVRFNGWFAGSAVAAACCVLIVYGITYQSPSSPWSAGLPGELPTTSVRFSDSTTGPNLAPQEDEEDLPSKPRLPKRNQRKSPLHGGGGIPYRLDFDW